MASAPGQARHRYQPGHRARLKRSGQPARPPGRRRKSARVAFQPGREVFPSSLKFVDGLSPQQRPQNCRRQTARRCKQTAGFYSSIVSRLRGVEISAARKPGSMSSRRSLSPGNLLLSSEFARLFFCARPVIEKALSQTAKSTRTGHGIHKISPNHAINS